MAFLAFTQDHLEDWRHFARGTGNIAHTELRRCPSLGATASRVSISRRVLLVLPFLTKSLLWARPLWRIETFDISRRPLRREALRGGVLRVIPEALYRCVRRVQIPKFGIP